MDKLDAPILIHLIEEDKNRATYHPTNMSRFIVVSRALSIGNDVPITIEIAPLSSYHSTRRHAIECANWSAQ